MILSHPTQNDFHQTNKQTNDDRCWQGCGDRIACVHCWRYCKLVQPLWKAVWIVLKELETELHLTQLYQAWEYFQRSLTITLKKLAQNHVHCCSAYKSQEIESA